MTNRSLSFAICYLLPIVGFAGLAKAAEAPAIARIGGTEIRSSELQAELATLDDAQRAALAKNPAMLNQAVRSLLVRQLVLKEALAKNWQNNAELVQQLERLREGAITESYLLSVTTPPAGFPSEAELKGAYEDNKAALIIPRQLRLSQIFIALPKNADKATAEKAQARADSVSKKLKDTPFAELVKLHSDEKSGANEAEIGWIAESLLQPAIREGAKDLAKGGVSQPIRMDDGWHIVKVLESRDSRTATFEEVREQLRQRIRAERQRASSMEYVNALLKANPVSINELELVKLLQSGAK